MTGSPDQDLTRLLTECVAAVEPSHRLGTIRAEAARRGAARQRRRRYAAGGAVLAAAAVVAAVVGTVVLLPTGRGPDPSGPAAGGNQSAATDSGAQSVTAYYLGDSPRGPRLYRELVTVDASLDPVDAALEALERTPADPDYRTPWPQDSFVNATVTGDAIEVEASSVVTDVLFRGNSAAVRLAEQQLVYSLQAAAGRRLPVSGDVEDRPFGPLRAAPAVEVMSLMSITTPYEGTEVTGAFAAEGRSNGFEGAYTWQLRRGGKDGPVVRDGYGTADGCCGDRLYPWRIPRIDVSTLPPGSYTFVVRNTDPSDGEGFEAPDSDTRTIVVE